MKQQFILSHAEARQRAQEAVRAAPEGYAVTVAPPTRSLEQNAALWPLLEDIAEQVNWYGKKLSPENWKDIFTSSLKRNQVVPALDGGGFVVLGQSTSQMTKREFSELLDLIHAFAAEKGVKFEEQAA